MAEEQKVKLGDLCFLDVWVMAYDSDGVYNKQYHVNTNDPLIYIGDPPPWLHSGGGTYRSVISKHGLVFVSLDRIYLREWNPNP